MSTFRLCRWLLVMLVIVLPGCSPLSAAKPVVIIGSPAHGSQVGVGQEVLVQVSATDTNGLSRIDLWVDGQPQSSSPLPAGQTAQAAVMRWTPATPGQHMVVVQAVNVRNVLSDPAAITVNAVGAPSATNTPTATATVASAPADKTSAPTPTLPPPPVCTYASSFVLDVTVPPGTALAKGQAYNKIWRIKNDGNCAWEGTVQFVYIGGEAMTTVTNVPVPHTEPGATADILVAMIAPNSIGAHAGQWQVRGPNGLFGAAFSVSINVIDTQASSSAQSSASSQSSAPPPASCPGAPVIASFTANPTTLEVLPTFTGKVTLSWGKVDNATSAAIDNGIGGIATPGSVDVNIGKTTTFTLTASGCGGTTTKQVTVTVKVKLVTIPLILPPDLAITGMRLVSTTGLSRLHVDVKNTGDDDFDGSYGYKCVVPQVMLRGSNQMVAALGDEGTLKRKIPKGGTDVFNPLGNMTFDATAYWYPQVVCVVTLDGDLTPNDNSMVITIP